MNKSTQIKMNRYRDRSLANPTLAELWAFRVLKESLPDISFQREYVINNRRFDFFFDRIKIAVEIDGAYHKADKQFLKDKKSDKLMFLIHKIIVLRIDNFDKDKLIEVINAIRRWDLLIPKKICGKRKKRKLITSLCHDYISDGTRDIYAVLFD